MKDFRAWSFEEVLSYLEQPADTLILFHRNPDADAVGSAFALKRILCELGSRAWCVCANEVPRRLQFLTDREQGSVLPTAVPEGLTVQRVISVDSASPAQLGELWELYGDWIDLSIDHHGASTVYADHYVIPEAAATGEILFDLCKQLAHEERITLTAELCTMIYAAISSDTGCFRYSNVTPETHLRAAELLQSGIDAAEINHLLFDSKSMELLRAESAGISNLHTFAGGRIAVVTFPYALKVALALEDEHLETLVELARSLEGVKVAAAIRQSGSSGVFRVSVRSSCGYDVSALCAQFGGGGHEKAAGCTITAADIDEAMTKLVDSVREDELI